MDTPKERFIKALRRQPVSGHVPTFELVFFLTAEKFGRLHPDHRQFHQWGQMSDSERAWHINDVADLFIETARVYHHDAIFVHSPFFAFDDVRRLLETIRKKSNDQYFLMAHGDVTPGIPGGNDMVQMSVDMYENPGKIIDQTKGYIEGAAKRAEVIAREGLLDGYALCSDYCFNTGPFFSPELFDQFVTPYLKQIIDIYHSLGLFAIKHTDGNIMPILDQMVSCGPDALHSLDPQGGVSMTEVRRRCGDKVAVIGNVNCGLLQTGSDEECAADIRRSLREGMDGGWGYIFSTSNCVYTGLDLQRYELMNKIWWEEGIYK